MKALGLVVSENIYIYIYIVFPMTSPGRGLYGPQAGTVGRIYKVDHYTLHKI